MFCHMHLIFLEEDNLINVLNNRILIFKIRKYFKICRHFKISKNAWIKKMKFVIYVQKQASYIYSDSWWKCERFHLFSLSSVNVMSVNLFEF